MSEFTLSKPFVFEEKEYTTLNLNMEDLTGADLENIEREMSAAGMIVSLPEASKSYQMYVAARSAKVPVALIKALPLRDASAITMKVQSFLLGMA
ncbi:tail assembly chaperone [Pararheinheimera phage vB_PsoM_KLER1-1]|nr:tail assembly chaperone [Pararheinheimera phage vB_PsoM_KLER1-1]